MARGKGRGGYQRPANPAPASGPGAASARTDGLGAAGLVADDLQHGDRQVIESMPNPSDLGPTPGPGPTAGGPPPGGAPGADLDVWGPSIHPGTPVDDGMHSVLADDPDEHLRVLYQAYPHPDILRLLEAREF